MNANTNKTVAEIQAAHLEAFKNQKFESVQLHELFGFDKPMKGLEAPIQIPADRHPLAPEIKHHVFDESLTRRLILSMADRDSIMLVGDKGTGKTSLIEQLNARLNRPLISITAGPGVDESYLIGCKTIENGSVKAMDGVLSYAYRHGLSCNIDELCSLRQGVLVGINDILQGDAVVTLKHHGIDPTMDPAAMLNLEGGMNIVRHGSFRLFATDNTGGKSQKDPRFAGVNTQNSAVRSRFTSFKVGFMSPEKEMAALQGCVSTLNPSQVKSMVEFAFRFRKAFEIGEAFDNVSFREIKRWATKTVRYGDIHEAFIDAVYTNMEASDQLKAEFVFDETFGVPLQKTDEHATSVASQLDKLLQAVAA